MLETLVAIGGAILGVATVWQAAQTCWRIVGGWHGLRHNPWVWGPLLGSLVAFLIVVAAARYVDHAKAAGETGIARVVAGWVILFALCMMVVGFGWALLAGTRRIRRIEKLLHLDEEVESIESIEGLDLTEISFIDSKEALRLIAEQRVTLQDLEELWQLLPPAGGVPELDWLTREWVRGRVAALPAGRAP